MEMQPGGPIPTFASHAADAFANLESKDHLQIWLRAILAWIDRSLTEVFDIVP
jgi:hypothetical protein